MKRIVCITASLFMLAGMTSCKKSGFNPDKSKISRAQINKQIKEFLRKAEGEKDDNLKARYLGSASELLVEKGDYNEAVRIARRARRANPTQKQALATIGEYYIYNGKFREAKLVLADALTTDRKYARANYLMGNACFAENEYREAQQYYLTSIKNDPSDIRAYNNLAQTYLKLGNNGQALAVLKNGIDKAPEFALTYKNAGIVAEKMNKKGQAKEYYEKYITLNPGGDDREAVEQWIKRL